MKGIVASAPHFSTVKSLANMAKLGGLSWNSMSLEGRSLLRAGTGLSLMAEAVPWLYMHLTTPNAGRQGREVWEPLMGGG